MKFTQDLLKQLESILQKSGFKVRYEKGNFKGGYCLLENEYIVVVNKFFPLEGKINTLAEVIENLPVSEKNLNKDEQQLVLHFKQKKLQF